jgi:hypothetical protein
MEAWCKRQLHIICLLTREDLVQWKKEYKENVIPHQNKYGGSRNLQNMAMVMLDQETEEISDVATFTKNNKKDIKESKTMYYLENIYIGHSGALCHMAHSDKGMYNIKNIKERITIGNGQYIEALTIGKKQGMIKLDNGTVMNVVLNSVKCVPELAPYILLFPIIQAISSGWMLRNE